MVKYGHFIFRIPADRPLLSRLIALITGAVMTAAFAPLGLSPWPLVAGTHPKLFRDNQVNVQVLSWFHGKH